MVLAIYIVAGIFAGLTAGLFGVGGGIIVVPVLVFAFEAQGFSADVLTHLAIGTSLATIVFTSISSIWSHHKRGAVLWEICRPMSLGLAVGAILGVWTVSQLDGILLKKLFGFFVLFVAFKMMSKKGESGDRPIAAWPEFSLVGVFVAWVSSIFGIGGGTLTVPFLSRFQIEMKYVVGTAAACGFPIALLGSISNMYIGQSVQGLPEMTIGYVYLPALLGISMTSVLFAKLGASYAHRLPSMLLRKLFACSLFIVGVRFLFF